MTAENLRFYWPVIQACTLSPSEFEDKAYSFQDIVDFREKGGVLIKRMPLSNKVGGTEIVLNFNSGHFHDINPIRTVLSITKIRDTIKWTTTEGPLLEAYPNAVVFVVTACLEALRFEVSVHAKQILNEKPSLKPKKTTVDMAGSTLKNMTSPGTPLQPSLAEPAIEVQGHANDPLHSKKLALPKIEKEPEFELIQSMEDTGLSVNQMYSDSFVSELNRTHEKIPNRITRKADERLNGVRVVLHAAADGLVAFMAPYRPWLGADQTIVDTQRLTSVGRGYYELPGAQGFSKSQNPLVGFQTYKDLFDPNQNINPILPLNDQSAVHESRLYRMGLDYSLREITPQRSHYLRGDSISLEDLENIEEALEYASENNILYCAFSTHKHIFVQPLQLKPLPQATLSWVVNHDGSQSLQRELTNSDQKVMRSYELKSGRFYSILLDKTDALSLTISPVAYENHQSRASLKWLPALEAQALRSRMLKERQAHVNGSSIDSSNVLEKLPLPKEIPIYRATLEATSKLAFKTVTRKGVKLPSVQMLYAAGKGSIYAPGLNIKSSQNRIEVVEVSVPLVSADLETIMANDLGAPTRTPAGTIQYVGYDPNKFDRWEEFFQKAKADDAGGDGIFIGNDFLLANPKSLNIAMDGKSVSGGEIEISVAVNVGGIDVAMSDLVSALDVYDIDQLKEKQKEGKGHVWADLEGHGWVKVPIERAVAIVSILNEFALMGSVDVGDRSFKINRFDLHAIGKFIDLPWGTGLDDVRKAIVEMRAFDWHEAVPDGLTKEEIELLKPSQRSGIAYMQMMMRHGLGVLLGDAPGAGKTGQALHLVLSFKRKGLLKAPALVACRSSGIHDWEEEIKKWTPSLNYRIHQGTTRHDAMEDLSDVDVLVTTHDTARIDEEVIKSVPWTMFFIDEAHHLRNPDNLTGALLEKLETTHRVPITGTPMNNSTSDIWSVMHLAVPGLLRSHKWFKKELGIPAERGDEKARAIIRRIIAPFIIQRDLAQCGVSFPPPKAVFHSSHLPQASRDAYEVLSIDSLNAVKKSIKTVGMQRSSIIVANQMMRLRQFCLHPSLLGIPSLANLKSPKLEDLYEKMETYNKEGRRVLIFSSFPSAFPIIRAGLKHRDISVAVIQGSTTDRRTPRQMFDSGEADCMLLSLKAAGESMNLQCADSVILLDPWWNPFAEDQAAARAARQGQTESVLLERMFVKSSIEEYVGEVQAKKRALAASILSDGSNLMETGITEEDLYMLFRSKA